nr:monocarboxylate transporter 3-like [Rhipicephalus microplus]
MRIYHIILLSTILNSVALIAAAFSPNITCMSIIFGAIHGFGMGLFTTSAGIYILLYFYKYRATALSIFYGVGWAVAGIVGQLILSALVNTYGFQGGLFLLGGIMMHSIPIVMLAGNPSPMSIACKWRETDPAEIRKSGPDDLWSANVINEGKAEGPQELRPICKPALPESCSVKHALALFATPAFYVIVAVIIIDDYSNVQFSTTIVDYAIDKGIPLDTAKTLISFASSGNLIGRVAVPFLADIRPRLRIPIYVLAFVLVTTVLIATTRVYAYEGVAALTLIHGISKGTLLCFRTVLIAEILGVDRSAACAGITGVTMIPLSLASPAILGSFRDGRGSYDGFYWMLAAINLAAAITFSIFAVLDRRRRIGTWTNDDCEKKN